MKQEEHATFSAADDKFHPTQSSERLLVETVWWNFYVPDANLDAEVYLGFRRNLGVVYAGTYVWNRFCRHFVDALHFDTRSYLPFPEADLDAFRLDNGLAMRVLEPLSRYSIDYEGVDDTSFSLTFDALAPPVGSATAVQGTDRANFAPGHFDQVGRMSGELRLHGNRIEVDCITHRDRSWGGVRRESPEYPPDVGWHSAHFGEELWMQCWLWHKEPGPDEFQSGVVYKRGRAVPLISARRETKFDQTGTEARFIKLWLRDAEGEEYLVRGIVRNMFPWPGWFNMVGFAGLVEWEWAGRRGWGEVHDGRTVAGVIARRSGLNTAC